MIVLNACNAVAYGRSVMTPRPTWQDSRDCCLGRNSTARWLQWKMAWIGVAPVYS